LLGSNLNRDPYVGLQIKIVRERKAMLDAGSDCLTEPAGVEESKDGAIPLIRRWLGDHFCGEIDLKNPADEQRYKAAFPEATIFLPPPPVPPRR
jgi:hypothetical protein